VKRTFAFGSLIVSFTLLLSSSAGASCRDLNVARGFASVAHASEPDVTIQYFGHNFFQITTGKGTQIVTDPLAPGMYPTPYVAPHVVTVGREHPNHNYVQLAQGNPIILRGLAHHLLLEMVDELLDLTLEGVHALAHP